MSSNNETNDPKNNPNNEPDKIPPQSKFNSRSNVPPQQNDGSNEEEHTRKVNNWKKYGWKWIEPLNIVTIALAVFTAMLFWQASNDSHTAEKAAKAAQDAVKEQQFNDSVFRRNDSIKFSNDTAYANKKFIQDSLSDNKNFEVSKNALQTQIDYLQQSQKDFELENRPFVQVSEIKIDASGYNAFLSFKIINYGKFPADVLQVKYRVGTALSINENKILYFKTQTIDHNIYVASGVNSLPEFGGMKSTSTSITNDIKNGNVVMYLYVEIRYTSYGSKKTFLHTSLNKIKYGVSNYAISNNDVEIK